MMDPSQPTSSVSLSDLQDPQAIVERFFHLETTVRTTLVKTISLRIECPRIKCLVRQELAATLSLLMKVKRVFRKEMLLRKEILEDEDRDHSSKIKSKKNLKDEKRDRSSKIKSNELVIIFESLELAVQAIACENPNPELSRQLRVDAEMYLTKYEYGYLVRLFVKPFLLVHRSRSVAVKVIGGLVVSSSVIGTITVLSATILTSGILEPKPQILQEAKAEPIGVQEAKGKPGEISNSLPQLNRSEMTETLFLLLIGASAGSAGSIVSILLRIKDIVTVDDDHRIDPILPIFLGLFKPVIGGAFGIFAVTLLSTKIISIGIISSSGARECLFFSIAFAVGFSERLAADVIKRAEDLVLSSAPSSQTTVATAQTVAIQETEVSQIQLPEASANTNHQRQTKDLNSANVSTQTTSEIDLPLEEANISSGNESQKEQLNPG